MKFPKLLVATALIGLTAFASCKKDDDSNNATPNSGNLDAGKGVITFNTSKSFGGATSYNGTNPTFSSALKSSGTAYDQVTIQTVEYAGTTLKTAQLIILHKKGLTTTSGAINSNFANEGSEDTKPVLVISNSADQNEAYASESGTFTISKLTATEVEGTFSGHFVNEEKGTSIEVSNGKFAGKF